MTKRILAILLTLAMVLSLVSVNVFAADVSDGPIDVTASVDAKGLVDQGGVVAEVKLPQAVKNGDKVTVIADFTTIGNIAPRFYISEGPGAHTGASTPLAENSVMDGYKLDDGSYHAVHEFTITSNNATYIVFKAGWNGATKVGLDITNVSVFYGTKAEYEAWLEESSKEPEQPEEPEEPEELEVPATLYFFVGGFGDMGNPAQDTIEITTYGVQEKTLTVGKADKQWIVLKSDNAVTSDTMKSTLPAGTIIKSTLKINGEVVKVGGESVHTYVVPESQIVSIQYKNDFAPAESPSIGIEGWDSIESIESVELTIEVIKAEEPENPEDPEDPEEPEKPTTKAKMTFLYAVRLTDEYHGYLIKGRMIPMRHIDNGNGICTHCGIQMNTTKDIKEPLEETTVE